MTLRGAGSQPNARARLSCLMSAEPTISLPESVSDVAAPDNVGTKPSTLGLGNIAKRMRKREFIDAWKCWGHGLSWSCCLTFTHPKASAGRAAFSMQTVLRIRRLQKWCKLSDPAMESTAQSVGCWRFQVWVRQVQVAGRSVASALARLPEVPMMVCIRPESASTPISALMPK